LRVWRSPYYQKDNKWFFTLGTSAKALSEGFACVASFYPNSC
jgi:hypothetical protein